MMKNNMQEEVKKENKYISIDDFAKVEIKLGTVLEASIVEGSEKLYKLSVDFAEDRPRTVFSGIRKFVSIDDIVGKQMPFVTNLEPRKIMDGYSEAMILAASEGDVLALLNPTQKLSNGVTLR